MGQRVPITVPSKIDDIIVVFHDSTLDTTHFGRNDPARDPRHYESDVDPDPRGGGAPRRQPFRFVLREPQPAAVAFPAKECC